MAGRKRRRKPVKQRQPGMAQRPLMRYDQLKSSFSMPATSGADAAYTLFDNSGVAGNKYVRIAKHQLQWFMNSNEQALFYVAVMKQKEGEAAPTLDDEATVRDAKSEGRLIRGPRMISNRQPGIETANVLHARKTIVLKYILLDPNDDLIFALTNATATLTGTNTIQTFYKVWWKVTE